MKYIGGMKGTIYSKNEGNYIGGMKGTTGLMKGNILEEKWEL